MRKLLLFLSVLALLTVGIAAAALWYVRPTEELDLRYREVNLQNKIAGMIAKRELAVVITDEEMNDLLKMKLSESPEPVPGVRVTGAKFTREGDRLYADLNLMVREQLPAAVRLLYRLQWREPYLEARFEEASVKGLDIPPAWLNPAPGDYRFNIEEHLPRLVGVRDVVFDGPGTTVWLEPRL